MWYDVALYYGKVISFMGLVMAPFVYPRPRPMGCSVARLTANVSVFRYKLLQIIIIIIFLCYDESGYIIIMVKL